MDEDKRKSWFKCISPEVLDGLKQSTAQYEKTPRLPLTSNQNETTDVYGQFEKRKDISR